MQKRVWSESRLVWCGTRKPTEMSQQIAPELPVRLRRVRDSGALLFMLAFLGFLAYIIWDGLYMKGVDIDLVVHGHDSFGNICGRNNKPIRFSSKSGRNYTEKPYTMYTLVNSKFERYTGRMRFGELVYVKEQPDIGDERTGLSSGKRLYSRSTSDSELAGKALEGPSDRILKFNERVEPKDSCNGIPKLIAVEREAPSDEAHVGRLQATKLGHEANGASLEDIDNGDDSRNVQDIRQDGGKRAQRRERQLSAFQTEAPMHFDLVELARTNRSLLNALRSNMMYRYPPMYGYNNPPPLITNQSGLNAASARHVGRVSNSTGPNQPLDNVDAAQRRDERNRSMAMNSDAGASLISSVVFADRAQAQTPKFSTIRIGESNNDSEHYDHVFVPPRNVITSGGSQISPSEISNQLLYLTECVSSCPSDHVELIFYRCVPGTWRLSLFPNAINVTRTFIDDVLTDVSHCYRELVYTFSLSLVLSLALLILLRFLASIIIWCCIVALILMFISMAGYSWFTFYNQIMDLEHIMPQNSAYAEKLANSDKWLIGSIFLTFMAFAIIGTVLFMRKRILLVTTLFKESGKAIADMPLLLLQPLFTFAVLALITAAWVMGLICLQSMKIPVVDHGTGMVLYRTETLYKIMRWYHVFSFLWVSHFAIACQHYVIGASVSKWYFSPDRYHLGSPIGTSISELILYYLGTVALGSFLLAIFKVIRVITRQIQFLVQRSCMSPPLNSNQAVGGSNYLNATSSSSSHSSSTCGSLGYVWRLFIWFFDNIVMIINRDAYVEVAIHGHSFLAGARRAFLVLASNPLRLLAIKSVGNLLLVLAKICIVIGTVGAAYLLLEGKNQQLNYSWSPMVISAIFAYVVAHWFLSVYEMVIDALFICYCEDYEQKNLELNQTINGSTFRAQILNNGQIY